MNTMLIAKQRGIAPGHTPGSEAPGPRGFRNPVGQALNLPEHETALRAATQADDLL
jgi:hypothetical protein